LRLLQQQWCTEASGASATFITATVTMMSSKHHHYDCRERQQPQPHFNNQSKQSPKQASHLPISPNERQTTTTTTA
jgi:hypothetical protein